jgi:predicted DNA-binding protein (MmcQ/YjbR family)
MMFDAFDQAIRASPGVALDIKWGVDRTYCVGGKMFVMAGALGQDEPRYMFKASDVAFEILTGSGAAAAAPYLGRAKWVMMSAPDSLSDDEVLAYARQAHALIAAKLTKRVRAELGIEG